MSTLNATWDNECNVERHFENSFSKIQLFVVGIFLFVKMY